jgi:hypothetical protein
MSQSTKTLPVDREEELRRQVEVQQKMLSKISAAAKFISFKGGNIIIDGKPIAGAKTEVIPLTFLSERTYFEGEFDPEVKQSPICYAYAEAGSEDGEWTPHKEAREKQSEKCSGCPHNEWGSAAKGRGKACRESVRLALIPNAADLSKQQVWHCRIPITSVPAFKTYAGELLGLGKPLHSVVAELSVMPDAKSFFKIHWMPKKATDPKQLGVVEQKMLSAAMGINFPYPNFEEEAQKLAKPLKTKKR